MTASDPLAVLAHRLRTLRVAREMTQAEAAQAAGIDPQYYNRIECGRTNVTFLTLTKITEALKACPGSLCAPTRGVASQIGSEVCGGVSHLVSKGDTRGLDQVKSFLEHVLGVRCICANSYCPTSAIYPARAKKKKTRNKPTR